MNRIAANMIAFGVKFNSGQLLIKRVLLLDLYL